MTERPAQPQSNGPADLAPEPVTQRGEMDAAARKRAGNSKGGKAKREVTLVGLGTEVAARVRTSEDQLRLVEAVVDAVAKGKTSALVASTILAAVKTAREITQ